MGVDDLELRRLQLQKLRKLASMSAGKKEEQKPAEPTPLERLKPLLVERADEVLEAARSQYPREAETIIKQLADLVASGRLRGNIDGGTLYNLFRSLGLRVKMDTRVLYVKHGEAKRLSDLLKKG